MNTDRPNPEQRWGALLALFEEVTELQPEERRRRLAGLERQDPEVARELRRLLAADEATSGMLDRPAAEVAADLLADLDESLEGAEGAEGADGSDGADRSDGSGESVGGDLAGLRLGPWRLLEPLGQGGMGEVWLAERADGQFEQQAAVKLVKRGMDSEDVLRRFRRERQILARLEHPRIAHLLDGGLAPDGRPYFVLERVRGASILEWAESRKLGVEARIELVLQAAEGIEFAHRNLVVHRDLKPSNILVAEDGQVKLLDFGIAKLLDPSEDADLTQTLGTRLTPRYAAPEQILGEPATTMTDVYALAAVLYELLTGEAPRPLVTSSPLPLARVVAHDSVERPSSVAARARPPSETARPRSSSAWGRRLAGDLDTILLRALAREPERRYLSMAAFADDLRRHLDGRPVLARGDTRGYRLVKFVGRHRSAVAAAAVALLSLIGGLAVTVVKERAARAQAKRAEAAQEFLSDLFLSADPDQSKGAKLTARDLLDRGAARAELALAGQPELLAEMLGLLGRVYFQLGLPAEAEGLFQRALELERRRLGDDDPRLALSYRRLSTALHRQAKYAAARPVMERSLALYRLGGDEVGALSALQNLALLARAEDDNEQARRLLTEVVNARSRLEGPYSPELAKSLNNLGIVLWREKSYRAAADTFERALAIHRRNEGEVSSLVANTEDNLAMVLNLAGDTEAAQRHVEIALSVLERLHDRPHSDVARVLSSVGHMAAGRGESERAVEFYERSIAVYQAAGFGEHPDAAYPIRHLAETRAKQGNPRAALALFRRALEIREKALGPEHRLVGETLGDLAGVQTELGDLAGAEASQKRADALKAAENLKTERPKPPA